MSVVAAYVYREGVRVREAPMDDLCAMELAPGEFVWIGILEPDEAELRGLAQRFNLHPLAVEDALNSHQMPKVDVYGNQLFVVTRTAAIEEDRIVYGETDVFVGPQHIITVRHGSDRGHSALRAHLEAAPLLLSHGVDYVLHGVLDFVVDGYLPVVEALEEEVLVKEQRALDTFLSRGEVRRIFHLRRDLQKFKRIMGSMAEVAGRLENLDMPCIDREARPYFRDVLDHVHRVEAMAEGLREALVSVFEASALLEQQRQSDVTRKLAAWAAILAVPTAVAGIYGMNFDHMPELHWRYGYAFAGAIILTVCAFLFSRFRKHGWL